MKDVLKWSLFSLAFVPLLVNFETLFPFIFTKTLLIRSAVTLFWILFAVWYFTNRKASKDVFDRNWRFFKNPLYIATSLFILLMLLSTVFAVDWYKAFFGDVERGEGFLGIVHFYAFFVAALLVFDKEGWATFFRFNLVTGAILLVDSIGELSSGEFIRAQSFVGNPTFLAGYFLFVTFAAMIAFFTSRKRLYWRIFSFLMIFGGIVGVFLTGTRGAILGLVAGSISSLLYFSIKGREVKVKLLGLKTNAQKASAILLILLLLGVGVFILTRENAVWQKIPGVDRFATLSLTDSTLQTRLISAGVSLNAVNPTQNDIRRFLIGYGPDNFNIAYNKYYNPEYMRYESLWFDRAHNKILDVLVMNGVFGLLVYLGMWFSVFLLAFRRIPEKEYAIPIIFFGTAYFVQNIFVFDQISTWIPFFAFLGFVVFTGSGKPEEFVIGERLQKFKTMTEKVLPWKLPIVAALFAFALVAYTFIPYSQSITFIRSIQVGLQEVINNADSFTRPYTYMQATLRNRLTTMILPIVADPQSTELVDLTVSLQEDFLAREPYDPRDMSLIGNLYRLKGNIGEPGAYDRAIEYELLALELSPLRQDHLHGLATLYADIGDYVTMQKYAQDLIDSAPTVARNNILYGTIITREGPHRYAEATRHINAAIDDPKIYFSGDQEIAVLRTAYDLYIGHFFDVKDEENFVKALEGARDFELKIEETNAILFELGLIPTLPEKRSTEFTKNLELFKVGGFDTLVEEEPRAIN